MRLTQKTQKLLDGTLDHDELAVAIAQIWLEGATYGWQAAENKTCGGHYIGYNLPKEVRRRNPYGKV